MSWLTVILRRGDAEGSADHLRILRRAAPAQDDRWRHDLEQIGEAIEIVIGLRGAQLFRRRRSGRDDGDIDSAVARGMNVDRHVADEKRLFRFDLGRLQRAEEMLRFGLARAGDVGSDDGAKVSRQSEKLENLA